MTDSSPSPEVKAVKFEFIDDLDRVWRFYSVHAALICALIFALIAVVTAMHLTWPVWIISALGFVAAVSGIVGRVVKQAPGDAEIIERLKNK